MNNNDINNLETQPVMTTDVQVSPVAGAETLEANPVNLAPVVNEGTQTLEAPVPAMGIPDPFATQEPVAPVAEGVPITPVSPVVDSLPVDSLQANVASEVSATEVLGTSQVAPTLEPLTTETVIEAPAMPTLDSVPVVETPVAQPLESTPVVDVPVAETPVIAPDTLVTDSNLETPAVQSLESTPVVDAPVAEAPVIAPDTLVTDSNLETPAVQPLEGVPVVETPVVETPIVDNTLVAPVNTEVASVESLDAPVETVNQTPVNSDITLLEAQETNPTNPIIPEPVPPVFDQTTRPDGSTSFVPVNDPTVTYQAPVMPEVTDSLDDANTIPVNYTSDGMPYPQPFDAPSDFVKIIGLLQKDAPIPEVAYGVVPTNADETLNATLEQLYQQKQLNVVQRQYALETPEGVFYPCGPLEATLYNEEEYARVVAPDSANQNTIQPTWCKVEPRTYDDWYKNSVESKVR